MSKRLMADGVTGRVAIIEGGSRDAFERPLEHFDKIHFHSDLDYLTLVQRIDIPYMSFPAVAGQYRTVTVNSSSGKGGKHSDSDTYTVPVMLTGTTEYVLGTVAGVDGDPMMGFVNGAPMTGMVVYESANFATQEKARRHISLSTRNGQIILSDNWMSSGLSLPQADLTNIKLIKMNLMSDSNPISAYKLLVQPNLFIASGGKLDSRARYLRKVDRNSAPFQFYDGRTMDSRSGGIRRAIVEAPGYVDDGLYNGTWLPNQSYGVSA